MAEKIYELNSIDKHVWMRGWINEKVMDDRLIVWKSWYIDGWEDGWLNVDGSKDGWLNVDGWKDGWLRDNE